MAVSKDTRTVAARKRATVRAQERSRRTLRTPGAVVESGVTAYSAVRAAQIAARKSIGRNKPPKAATYSEARLSNAAVKNKAHGGKTSKGRPVKSKTIPGPFERDVVRTRAATRAAARLRRLNKFGVKPLVRQGQRQRAVGSSSTAKAPVKPSARSNSAKYRGRKNK